MHYFLVHDQAGVVASWTEKLPDGARHGHMHRRVCLRDVPAGHRDVEENGSAIWGGMVGVEAGHEEITEAGIGKAKLCRALACEIKSINK